MCYVSHVILQHVFFTQGYIQQYFTSVCRGLSQLFVVVGISLSKYNQSPIAG